MFLACPFGMWDNTVRDSLLHDYEITYSPHKELYTIDDEIEITLTYEKLKAYYHSLTIDVTGGEYISEKSNWVSDKNISVRDKASGVAVLNRKLSLDLDTTSDNDRTFVVTPKKDGKYTINFSLTYGLFRPYHVTSTLSISVSFSHGKNP